MSFRNFDNSSSPRLVTRLNDRAQAPIVTQAGDRVVVLGFFKPEKDTNDEYIVPVQELYPAVPGSLTIDQLISDSRNFSEDATPAPYPSEVSMALEELRDAGVSNAQIINLGYDSRYRDMTSRMARERYIGLENAYNLLLDLEVDALLPVNVVPGLGGDQLYNNSDYEVLYDIELYNDIKTADPNDARISYSSVEGYVQMDGDSEYAKSTAKTANKPEDLAYLTATVCDMITNNGNFCTTVLRTLNPMEVKFLGELDLIEATSSTGTLKDMVITGTEGLAANVTVELIDDDSEIGGTVSTVLNGSTVEVRYDFNNSSISAALSPVTKTDVKTAIEAETGIVGVVFSVDETANGGAGTDTVSLDTLTDSVALLGGTDGMEGTTFGATAAGSTEMVSVGWSFVKTGSGATSNVFSDWDFAGADTAVTGDAVLAAIEDMAYFVDKATNASGIKPVFKLNSQPKAGVNGATYKDVIAWGLLYGTPSVSETNKWVRFLEGFGNGADTEIFENNICSYIELDGVSSVAGDRPDNFKFYRTEDGEKPTTIDDSSIVKDDLGNPVDMGRYLDVVAANSIYQGGTSKNLIDPANPKAPINLAGLGVILGWYNSLPSSIATTRQSTSLLTQNAYIGTTSVSRLTRNRYQVFSTRDGIYTFNRDITMAIFVSDIVRSEYLNRMTGRIVKDAVEVAGIEGRKLLGKSETTARIEGLRQALEVEFGKWANPEDGRFRDLPTVQVYSSSVDNVVGRLTIELNLAVANEILEITSIVNLER